ncbi:hypothetical protein [Leptospira adleri]|uniref:Uncharacterized protein n=1 Tax=Leptospira adleri TaxID=2023186 RepID=A0A2M9YQA8_9LEPT|nr:hypothetical protein [Leptospira adleri]PJZ53709.1 hypothetical protein CH380_08980 [Leptospira adleri]PJZ61267.1 hypothetical protein CH376_14260 [Leptospira adleri]
MSRKKVFQWLSTEKIGEFLAICLEECGESEVFGKILRWGKGNLILFSIPEKGLVGTSTEI